jgi:hypothetical protein
VKKISQSGEMKMYLQMGKEEYDKVSFFFVHTLANPKDCIKYASPFLLKKVASKIQNSLIFSFDYVRTNRPRRITSKI